MTNVSKKAWHIKVETAATKCAYILHSILSSTDFAIHTFAFNTPAVWGTFPPSLVLPAGKDLWASLTSCTQEDPLTLPPAGCWVLHDMLWLTLRAKQSCHRSALPSAPARVRLGVEVCQQLRKYLQLGALILAAASPAQLQNTAIWNYAFTLNLDERVTPSSAAGG